LKKIAISLKENRKMLYDFPDYYFQFENSNSTLMIKLANKIPGEKSWDIDTWSVKTVMG
jgi:hypothetical protein